MIIQGQGSLLIDELSSFLDAIGAKPICPFCNNDSWRVPTDQQGGLMNPGHVIVLNGKWSAICTRCGFIREHSVAAFVEWRGGSNG